MTDQSQIRHTITRAVGWLRGHQAPDGSWRDFEDVPVGASDQWVTAYVGLALAETARAWDMSEAATAAASAADFLTRRRTYAAGWGYHAATGADADSTAHALLLLVELGLRVEPTDISFLAAHRQADSGFATYLRDDCWGQSHPCVSPVAALALAKATGAREDALATRYALLSRQADGTWPCYWWESRLYATWQNLMLQWTLGIHLPPPAEPLRLGALSLFDLVWGVGIAALAGLPARSELEAALLAAQGAEGGWPGQRVLRVTDPDCAAPWAEPRGRCHADGHGFFTTASALRVLSLAHRVI